MITVGHKGRDGSKLVVTAASHTASRDLSRTSASAGDGEISEHVLL